MQFLYSFVISLYFSAIKLAAIFNSKAKLWVNGRKNIFLEIEKTIERNANIIWVHCASLGEFEQGRSIIEKLKNEKPEYKILLTFFSPSGYEIRKNYSSADYVFYLPADSKSNAKKFIALTNPKIVIFIKYEFWYHYLHTLKVNEIPVFLASANFRDNQHFFKWYGGFFRKILTYFDTIFVQNEKSFLLIKKINKNVHIAGDTRFDRVYEIEKNVNSIELINDFRQNKSLFIAGSTWPDDEKLFKSINPDHFKLIIAPHEISEENIKYIENLFPGKTIRFSKADNKNIIEPNVLIIDNIGMLSSLYQYANISYIGGGFGKGIHNILEAATFGIPVIFGPKYSNFIEAKELIRRGGAFAISSEAELIDRINFLTKNPMIQQIASEINKNYIRENLGATQKIFSTIFK